MKISFLIQFLMVALWSRKADGRFAISDLRVDCAKDGLVVTVDFEAPFHGIIYSKGFHETSQCRYVPLSNGRDRSFNFKIPKGACGTGIEMERGARELVMENTIIIQNDPDITEAWDAARRLRCVWRDSFSKIVTFKPFQVSESVMVPLNFTQDAVNTVVQVQTGRGPFSRPTSGYVQVGDESSLVVFIEDPTNRYDARMLDCRASNDGQSTLILTDGKGCITRPELMTPFYKTRSTRHTGANLIMYTHFRAFRLANSPKFHISCNMQVCDRECFDPCRNKSNGNLNYKRRPKRFLQDFEKRNSTHMNSDASPSKRNLLRCHTLIEIDATWIAATLIFGAISVFLLCVLLIAVMKLRELRMRILYAEDKPGG